MERFQPKLTAPLPMGWFGKESLTMLAPDGQANLIASSEPLDPSIDTTSFATMQGELLRKEFSRYLEHSFEPAQVFGLRQGYIRRFEWTPPDGVAVRQIQIYYVESARGYTATATTPAVQYNRFEAQFQQMLDGLSIDS